MLHKIKLVMVCEYPKVDGNITGGVEAVSNILIRELETRDEFDLHVIAPGGQKDTVEARGATKIYWLGTGLLPGFLRYWTIERKKIHRIIRSIAPDIVHFQGTLGWSLGFRQPHIATIHGIAEKDVLFSFKKYRRLRSLLIESVEQKARNMCMHHIYISPYLESEISRSEIAEVRHISNPVTRDFFQLERRSIKKRLLYVGRISERKNVDGLIRVFNRVCQTVPDSMLSVCGQYESQGYFKKCQMLVESMGLTDNVEFMGNLDRDSLKDELSKATALCLFSHHETAPMVIEEAMASGVPVVAYGICGIPYMMKHGDSGFLVGKDNEQEAAETLVNLLLDQNLVKRIGVKARAYAVENYHVGTIVDKTINYYKAVIASSR